MAVRGVFTSDQNIQGTRKNDYVGALLKVHPTGSAQLLALSSGMPSTNATGVVSIWFEENHISGRLKVSTGGNSAATSIIVDDASSIPAGTVMEVMDTAEQIFVTAVSGNTLTITRGFAGTTANTIATSTTYVQRLYTAHEEGSSKPTAVANIGQPILNYQQIFRNAWDVTGTARAQAYEIEGPPQKNEADAALFHSEDIERAFWWGKKVIGMYNSKPFRVMDGILTQISTNDAAVGGVMGWTYLDNFLQSVFTKNIKGKPNERIAFGGNTALAALGQIARAHGVINITPGQTEFGLNVNKWITPYGNISLMTHPLMVESADWTKDLHVLHPGAIETRYLRRTTHDRYDRDGTRAGVDGDYGIFTTECSIVYQAEETGGSLTGITGGSSSS